MMDRRVDRRFGPTRVLVALFAFLTAASALAAAQPDPVPQQKPDTGLDDDVTLGLQLAVTLEETVGFADDEAWDERIDRIGYRTAAASGDSRTPYSFEILDLPEPNALALPGGFIFVTRGMMEIGLDDDQLANLLGHEIAHVRKEHFQRSAQLGSLISLVQTALLLGILVGVDDASGSAERVEVSDDPGAPRWSVGLSGKEALVQGVSLFSDVLQALFSRSYSRKLEFEADEAGQRIAARAGFDPAGGPGLLQELHERSYETHRFGYWRTHPYFDDRVARARDLAQRLSAADLPPDASAFGERVALVFWRAAERVPGEREALYLYEHALRAAARGVASLDGGLELARFRARRESRKHELERCHYCAIAVYDTLIARAERSQPDWPKLDATRKERAELEASRERTRAAYLAVISRDGAGTPFLKRFIENYPDDPQVPEAILRLAANKRLTDQPEEAVEQLERLLEGESCRSLETASVCDSASTAMVGAIGEVKDMTFCQRLIDDHGTADPRGGRILTAASDRLETLIKDNPPLEQAGEYVRRYPESPWSSLLRERLDIDAGGAYRKGRVLEGLQRYQEALDAYFSILAWAPESPAAEEAVAGIERINKLERLDEN